MLISIRNLPWPLTVSIAIAVAIILGTIIMLIVRRSLRHKDLEEIQDVTITTLGFVGMAFTILVGFTVLIAQQWVNDAELSTEREANILHSMLRDAHEFAPNNEDEIQKSIIDYVRYIVHDEWPQLVQERTIGPEREKYLSAIWQAYQGVEVNTLKEKAWYTQALNKLDDFIMTSYNRLEYNGSYIYPVLWALVLVSGFLSAMLIFFFWVRDVYYNFAIVTIHLATITFLIFLIFTLNNPFNGGMRVEPYDFNKLLQEYQQEELEFSK